VFFLEFVQEPPHKYIYFAWRYLEEAAEVVSNPPKKSPAILLELERHLIGAAASLRASCEAKFGRGRLEDAPNQRLMHFITAARHLGAHVTPIATRAKSERALLQWDRSKQTGMFEVDMTFTLAVKNEDLDSTRSRDEATRFLMTYGGDLYLALHAALREVANWVSHPLDSDFENLVRVPAGKLRASLDVPDRATAERVVRAFRGEEPFHLDDWSHVKISHPPAPMQ
jgi:hypothetical protein